MSPAFHSRLAPDLTAFVAFKQALGHPYRRAHFTLRSFDRYVAAHAPRSGRLAFAPLLFAWLKARDGRKPVTITNELGVLRQFCRFRRRHDPHAFVPERGWAPQATVSVFRPVILSPSQVQTLVRATVHIRGPVFRQLTVRTLLQVLYCTGLRFGEAVRLQLGDIDLRAGVLVVRESKGKTRLVPFRADLRRVLARYLRARHDIPGATTASQLFLQPDGAPLLAATASGLVCRLLRRTGLKPARGRAGVRPYDLRHTYAVHRLTRWYRAGVDVPALLPWLAVYLGHDSVVGTETYLPATPELLARAGRRFAAHVRRRR